MIDISFDPARSAAIRGALVENVRVRKSVRARSRLASWFAAMSVGLLALGGGLTAASAAGWIGWPFPDSSPLPGGDVVEVLPVDGDRYPDSAAMTDWRVIDETGSGNEVFPLGPVPRDATHISVFVTCETSGAISFGTRPANNPSISCGEDDRAASTWYDFPVADDVSLFIDSANDVRWSLEAVYLTKRPTDLAVNANGQTYGIEDAGPDLVAVYATNGLQGYVFAAELAEADGTAAMGGFSSPEEALAWQEERGNEPVSIPVYLSDGQTQVGEFIVGGR